MTKRQITLIIGLVVFLTPFLGISESMKYYIISFLGLVLIFFAFTLKGEEIQEDVRKANGHAFLESNSDKK